MLAAQEAVAVSFTPLLLPVPFPEVIEFRAGNDSLKLVPAPDGTRLTLVNVMASWCPPCIAELPYLAQLQKAYADRGLRVVIVTTEASAEKARELLEKVGASSLPMLADPLGHAESLGVSTLPVNFLLDAKGNLTHRAKGRLDTNGDAVEGLIDTLLSR